jgi:hypothetical protein
VPCGPRSTSPLGIQQVELIAADAGQIDVVDIDADGGIEGLQRVGLADAADEDVGRVGRAATLDDIEVRNGPLQAGCVRRLNAIERSLVEGRNGRRHALDVFRRAPRRDGDVLRGRVAAFVIGGGGRFGRGRLVGGLLGRLRGRLGLGRNGNERRGRAKQNGASKIGLAHV